MASLGKYHGYHYKMTLPVSISIFAVLDGLDTIEKIDNIVSIVKPLLNKEFEIYTSKYDLDVNYKVDQDSNFIATLKGDLDVFYDLDGKNVEAIDDLPYTDTDVFNAFVSAFRKLPDFLKTWDGVPLNSEKYILGYIDKDTDDPDYTYIDDDSVIADIEANIEYDESINVNSVVDAILEGTSIRTALIKK